QDFMTCMHSSDLVFMERGRHQIAKKCRESNNFDFRHFFKECTYFSFPSRIVH
ncbi:hypothetical protein KI387_012933, partial [Taxus chinensis]